MAKMTTAQARKRCIEAGSKLLRTVAECKDLTVGQRNKLYKHGTELLDIALKLK
jgi:hypothetical protein